MIRGQTALDARVEIAIASAACVVAAKIGGAQTRHRVASTLGVAAVLVCVAMANMFPEAARAAVIVLHPAVAMAAWATVFRARGARARGWIPPLALVLGLTVALVAMAASLPAEKPLAAIAAIALPPFPSPLGAAIIRASIYLQSVHYAIWLLWIPHARTPREALPTFRMAARAWIHEIGGGVLFVAAGVMAVLCAVAAFAPRAAAEGYVFLAGAHGYLELVAAAFLAGRGRVTAGPVAT
jgi:hypothetical protein